MAQPYVGEIRMFGGNFAPVGWAFCNGALMPISENDTLFTLIGTTYGGNGTTTFQLPNLQGRLPIHQGTGGGLSNYTIGQAAGVESVTLSINQIPSHNHLATVSTTAATASSPQGNVVANGTANLFLRDVISDTMNANSVGISGGSQPHSNIMPYLCISFIISLYGVFPSQT
jgi:microcystin-dependent protein